MKNLILASLFLSSLAFSETISCKTVVSNAVIDEMGNAHKLSALVMKEINKTSRKTIAQLKKTSVLHDAICIGAGPQCAAASLVLAQGNLKALVVDKANTVASNFAEKDFMINSSETAELTMHDFPGGRLEFANVISTKYANSRQLAAYIQALQYQSRIPVALGTEVISFDIQKLNGSDIVVMKTQNGLTLKTRNLIIGTGLGEAGTKIPAPFYKSLYKEMIAKSQVNPQDLQIVMNTETFMKALHIDPKRQSPIKMPKTVAVIGNGDGARISIEEMLEKHVVLPEGFKIIWIGNDYQTAEAYVASQRGWDRYIDMIVPHYQAKRLSGVPGYAMDAQINEAGRLNITVQDPDTKATQVVEADMVVDSTGYDNRIKNQLGQFLGAITLKDVKGDLNEREQLATNVARQVVLDNGTQTPIFFVGASAGPLWSKEQLAKFKNRNPVAIYNNVPLTQEFVEQLFNLPGYQRDMGILTERQKVQTAEEIFKRL